MELLNLEMRTLEDEGDDSGDDQSEWMQRQRCEDVKQELLAVLDAEEIDEEVRKRHVMRLFDRFRQEYTQLSMQLREAMHAQRKSMDKCREVKNALVRSAMQLKTLKQVQDEEMKNLIFYREECEHAWEERKVSEGRERDAIKIIDDLKLEIEDLQGQIKTLLNASTPALSSPLRRRQPLEDSLFARGSPTKTSFVSPLNLHDERPASSAKSTTPSKHAIRTISTSTSLLTSGSGILAFDEWKVANRVWSPEPFEPRTATPTRNDLQLRAKQQEIVRCVSVPSLHPTAMERASTAVAGSSSPLRRKVSRTSTAFGSSQHRNTLPLPHV